jgi:ferredoxin--NADP+ reductase
VGKTTAVLSQLNVGDDLPVFVGPLGKPTHIENFGSVVCVGGGIGVAPLYPVAQALKRAGNHITVIMGARSKELLILEREMSSLADELIVCTDDGSYGRKDLVTIPLEEICERSSRPDRVFVIGPPVMMKYCSAVTLPYDIYTEVSLNTIMVDGTGMCGGCRVNVNKQVKFVCVDGPEFNGHLVDFDNMIARLNSYKTIEMQKKKCFIENASNKRR